MEASRLSSPRRNGRDGNLAAGACAVFKAQALMRIEQVNLVHDFDARLGERVEFAENLFDLRFLLVAVGGGGVAHVEQNFSLRHFFKRGAEAGDQGVGQVADEADRVREKDLSALGSSMARSLGSRWQTCARTGALALR